MRDLWGKKVTVKGMGYFNPSGRIRFIDADLIKPHESGEQIFEKVPVFKTPADQIREIKKPYPAVNPLKEIWGKWPGDESIDELLAALNNENDREE